MDFFHGATPASVVLIWTAGDKVMWGLGHLHEDNCSVWWLWNDFFLWCVGHNDQWGQLCLICSCLDACLLLQPSSYSVFMSWEAQSCSPSQKCLLSFGKDDAHLQTNILWCLSSPTLSFHWYQAYKKQQDPPSHSNPSKGSFFSVLRSWRSRYLLGFAGDSVVLSVPY